MRARLGDICKIISGTTPKSSNPEYWNGDIDWITPAEISDDTNVVYSSVRKITKQAVKDSSLRAFPEGTVILSSRAPIGKVAIAGKEMYCNQGFKNLICGKQIFNRYLYWFLKSKMEYLNTLGRGATFKEISKAIVENIEIPLPPLEEQRKIAAVLDKIDSLISKHRQQLEKLGLLVKSQFVEMFGNGRVPKLKLKDACRKITDGEHGTVKRQESGRLYLMARNITPNSEIDLTNIDYISEEDHQKIYKRCNAEEGDVLLVCVGATIGKTALVPKMEEFSLARSVALIKPDERKLNGEFLLIAIKSDSVQMQIRNAVHSSAQGGLYTKSIQNLEIEVPPLELQNRFATFVQQADQSKFAINQSLEKLETLKKALMQDYFE